MKKTILFLTMVLSLSFTACSKNQTISNVEEQPKIEVEQGYSESSSIEKLLKNPAKTLNEEDVIVENNNNQSDNEQVQENKTIDKVKDNKGDIDKETSKDIVKEDSPNINNENNKENEKRDNLTSEDMLKETKSFMENLNGYTNTFNYEIEAKGEYEIWEGEKLKAKSIMESSLDYKKNKKDIEISGPLKTIVEIEEESVMNSTVPANRYYLNKDNKYYTYEYDYDSDKGWERKDIKESEIFKVEIDYDYLLKLAPKFKVSESKNSYKLTADLLYKDIFNIINLGFGNKHFDVKGLGEITTRTTIMISKDDFRLQKLDINEIKPKNQSLIDLSFINSLYVGQSFEEGNEKQEIVRLKLGINVSSYKKQKIEVMPEILYEAEHGKVKSEAKYDLRKFQFKDIYSGIEDLVLLDLSKAPKDYSMYGFVGENEWCVLQKEGEFDSICNIAVYKDNIKNFKPKETYDGLLDLKEDKFNLNNYNVKYFEILYMDDFMGFEMTDYIYLIEINEDYCLSVSFNNNKNIKDYIDLITSSLK